MNRLHLELSDRIRGSFTADICPDSEGRFYLNTAFSVLSVSVNESPVRFSVTGRENNWQTVSFPLTGSAGIVAVEYEGTLDGTTGMYPYVREKTTDDFYILRSESIYYPVFNVPGSAEYFKHLIEPSKEDSFEMLIELKDDRVFCTNLTETASGTYEGHNPTITVGYFKKHASFFGSVFYTGLEESVLAKTEEIVRRTNDFMNRYKTAEISGFKVIVIPDGYGSFVLPGAMFITKEVLRDYKQLVHELIHTNWNPKCTSKEQRSRFFDEAVTQYLTLRVCDALGIMSREQIKKEYADTYKRMINEYGCTPYPITEYSSHEAGDLSYSFGALALISIDECIGERVMDECIRTMLKKYGDTEIDFKKFHSLFPESADNVFEEYFYTLKASDKLLKG